MFSKIILSIFLIALTLNCSADPYEGVSVGLFNEPAGDRAGTEISVTFLSEHFGGKLNGVLYATKNKGYEDTELYGGFSALAFVHFDQVINPYLGIGLFAGESFNCSTIEVEQNRCSEEAILAIYPELGIEVTIMQVTISPYIRRYFDTKSSSNSDNVYGINFGVTF
jgi:hypothetical protein